MKKVVSVYNARLPIKNSHKERSLFARNPDWSVLRRHAKKLKDVGDSVYFDDGMVLSRWDADKRMLHIAPGAKAIRYRFTYQTPNRKRAIEALLDEEGNVLGRSDIKVS